MERHPPRGISRRWPIMSGYPTTFGKAEVTPGTTGAVAYYSDGTTVGPLGTAANIELPQAVSFPALHDNGNSGVSKTVDWGNGNRQKITTTGSCTVAFTDPAGPCNLLLEIVHEVSSTSYTYTWPGSVKWAGATKLSTSNTTGAVDVIAFFFDGANYLAQGAAGFA
jgi:hypothetical protein